MQVIASSQTVSDTYIEVLKDDNGFYHVVEYSEHHEDIRVRHPNCTAEDVIRTLSHYLNGVSYNYRKLLSL